MFNKFRKSKLIVKVIVWFLFILLLLISISYILALTHRKEIVNTITQTFHDKLTGQLSIGDVDFSLAEDFPNFTIRLENISVMDSSSAIKGDTLLTADHVSFRINIPKLIFGTVQLSTIKITNASVDLVKYKNGQMNTPKSRVVTVSSEKETGSLPVMKRIFLTNVSFKMIDSVKMKNFGLTFKDATMENITSDSTLEYRLDGLIHFDGLVFNQEKGGYLTDQNVKLKAKVTFDTYKKLLSVDDGTLTVQNQKLNLLMRMNFSDKTMRMKFDTESILPSVAYSLLTPAISKKLAVYQLEHPVMARVLIVGSFTPGSKPAVDVYFKSAGNRLNLGDRSFDNLKLLGQFTNHVDGTKINDDHNSKVFLPVFWGTVYGFPIQSQIIVTDLLAPNLYMRATVTYDSKMEGELTTGRFRFTQGNIKIDFLFDAPLIHYIDTVNQTIVGRLKGDILINHVSFIHLATGYDFTNASGHISFDRPNLTIDSMRLTANGNTLKVSGTADHFVSFIFIQSNTAHVNLDVKGDTINFNSFKRAGSSNTSKAKTTATRKTSRSAVASRLDWMAGSLELDMKLAADKIIYKRFTATNVTSNVSLTNDFVKVDHARMNTSGGTFMATGGIIGLSGSKPQLNVKASIKNARINNLMYSFDDFNQNAVTHENVFGTLSATADFSATLNHQLKVMGSTMSGRINTSIKNGSLKGMDALQKITKYVFKNRDFTDIQFADLHNQTVINGTLLNIDTLDIFSSVLTMFISGTYDFSKVKTDLLVSIPFSNLKKMEAKERMEQADSTARKGGKLVLRATNDEDGNLKITPVIFGKKKKDKS